jgi:GT2 family glycosyltransferase
VIGRRSTAVAAPWAASVIVPTFARRDRLARLLDSLEATFARSPRFEVIVVVDGSTDGTSEMLARLRPTYPLTVRSQDNRGPSAARNRAIETASGDVLIFLDDDVAAGENLVARHLEVHEADDRAVVIGRMAPWPGLASPAWLRWEAGTLDRQYAAMGAGRFRPSPRQFFTANASVRRVHALAVGAFDESYHRAEDVEFAHRLEAAGLHFYFCPEAVVLHHADRTYSSWLSVAHQYGNLAVRMERSGWSELRAASRERVRRHMLSRILVRLAVGRPALGALLTAALGLAIRIPLPGWAGGVQLPLCGAVFNVQFWQAVADETAAGTEIWACLEDASRWQASIGPTKPKTQHFLNTK